ncbi:MULTISPECIES: head-tail adaptor protein [unclassified Sinorhizobium]|uniref:head-tail adaptor protein n=1 Tax=unclassified Sinorhizobium TaxID=2613772 RepID=UPI0024C3436C|nr:MULTISPECIES: head-tail adaptor protein [unclassified Sinorhizobium]MDK1372958.1 head-tail adaptor protein [Sinorhizobium sp. 6-70]MDK1477486.1 head-tail adaptor protein [Sinorhizobium sp. 6-117]
MLEAGKLTTPIALMYRPPGNDGYGGTVPWSGPWTELFRTAADMRTIRGSETVVGQMLANVTMVEFWTRYRPEFTSQPINEKWQVKTTRDGRMWDIKLVDIDSRRRFVRITAQTALFT